MNYDWKRAVRRAESSSSGSSGMLGGFDEIKFWRHGNKWMFRNHDRTVSEIVYWTDILVDTIHFKPVGDANYAEMNRPNHVRRVDEIKQWQDFGVESIHFRPIGRANYAKMNCRDEVIVDELTKSIMRGDVKIIGPHSCVNNLGEPPVQGCKEIEALVPVPIIRQGDPIYAQISKVKVSRGGTSWYMYKAYIEESTGSGNNREEMEKNRIYMCGGL